MVTMTFEVPDTKVVEDDTEYIMSNPKIMKAIGDGDKQIASGNFTTTKLENLWKT